MWNVIAGESGWNPNQDRERTSSSPSQDESQQQSKRPTIIVIDDNPTDTFLVQEILTASNINADVLFLEDGEQALGLVAQLEADPQAKCPDLVLLDINLPRMDGFQVLAHLRKNNRSANVAVIVMTSSAAQEDRTRAMSLQVNAYFLKPYNYNEFLKLGEIIKHALGHN